MSETIYRNGSRIVEVEVREGGKVVFKVKPAGALFDYDAYTVGHTRPSRWWWLPGPADGRRHSISEAAARAITICDRVAREQQRAEWEVEEAKRQVASMSEQRSAMESVEQLLATL